MSYHVNRIAYIGLGSNLDTPVDHVITALHDLAATSGITLLRCSSLYSSAPIGFTDQPNFVNAVVAVRTRLAPVRLLKALKAIERKHRRTRSFPNAPRTLDLDILLYEQLQLSSADVTLPHPRAHERAFVLLPLVEIAPDISIPGQGRANQLLAKCADQPIKLLRHLKPPKAPDTAYAKAVAVLPDSGLAFSNYQPPGRRRTARPS